MINLVRHAVVLAAMTGVSADALAAAGQPETPITVISRDIRYDVMADGSYSTERVEVVRVNNAQGAKAIAQISLSHNAARQEQQISEAFVIGPGGGRVEVPKSEIKSKTEDKNGNAPQFEPVTITTINFPGLVPGAEIHFKVLRRVKQAFFNGRFSAIEMFPRQTHFRHGSVTVRAPAAMALHAEAIGLSGGHNVDDAGKADPARQVWTWTLAEQAAAAPEPGSVGLMDTSARVTISSFASYAEVARSYDALARPRAQVTPAVQKQADEITHDITGHGAQSQALYNWVATNIKHVPIYLDFGGVVPHDADAVLAARRGDSKDHNVLLGALLAAKGIASSPVLVNAANSYWLPEVAAAPGQFNLVLTYVPELSIYLDSTNDLAPYGVLASNLTGKPALLVDDGKGNSAIVKLPVAGPWNDKVQEELRMVVKPDGTVEGRGQVVSGGLFEEYARQTLARVTPGAQSQIAEGVLKLSGQSGTGDYVYEDAKDIAKPFRYSTVFKLPVALSLQAPGSFRVPDGLGSLSNIASTFEAAAPESRTLPIPMHGRSTLEVIRVALPEAMKEVKLPEPTSIDSKFGHFESVMDIDAKRILIVRRALTLRNESTLISPADYPEFRRFALSVLQDLRTPIEFR